MTVQQIFAGRQFYEVTGTGYDASGVVQADGKPVVPEAHPALLACLRAGLLCNDSVLIRDDGKIRLEGDPTEAALIVAAEKTGLAHAEVRRELDRLDAIPFESEHQFMATCNARRPNRSENSVRKSESRRRTDAALYIETGGVTGDRDFIARGLSGSRASRSAHCRSASHLSPEFLPRDEDRLAHASQQHWSQRVEWLFPLS
jgi:magnesium-transporting ATPase (P-type)